MIALYQMSFIAVMLRKILLILFLISAVSGIAQQNTSPDFTWGNASYFNLAIGEKIIFNNIEVRLLDIQGRCNRIVVGDDTIWVDVAQRNLPSTADGMNLFVADNRNLKKLDSDSGIHGLLKKDALLCLTEIGTALVDPDQTIFPVAFNDGFIWSGEEESYIFSYQGNEGNDPNAFPGIGIDLSDSRGLEKHWIVAFEDCSVIWVEDGETDNSACVLLKSKKHDGIYFVYDRLYKKNIEVRKGQELRRGELIGTAWGDNSWGHLQLAVVYSETEPDYASRYRNCVNFFPQLYVLYYNQTYGISRTFSKGQIEFGRAPYLNRNVQNASGFTEFFGKGWVLDRNNIAGRMEWVARGDEGNVRLSKTLFKGTSAKYTNPENYYCYTINVQNGVYRIRARIGDIEKKSYQKISFDGVETPYYELPAGQQKWTAEKVVRVTDYKLNVRVFIDATGKTVAGLSEIVFQQSY